MFKNAPMSGLRPARARRSRLDARVLRRVVLRRVRVGRLARLRLRLRLRRRLDYLRHVAAAPAGARGGLALGGARVALVVGIARIQEELSA